MRRKTELFMSIALICCAVFLAKAGADFAFQHNYHLPESPIDSSFSTEEHLTSDTTTTSSTEQSQLCIVIDAGHGGSDPGKIGCNGVLEKNINLSIALLLKATLEKENLHIILTRETDSSLANANSSNPKRSDMQNRCEIINNTNPIFTISIHQNSYPSPEIAGAQVFYYTSSTEGCILATTLQTALKNGLDPTNHRQPKANDTYYLLKKTPTPTVIVECGFLSNPSEAALLATDDYQQKIVSAISAGIFTYLQENNYL